MEVAYSKLIQFWCMCALWLRFCGLPCLHFLSSVLSISFFFLLFSFFLWFSLQLFMCFFFLFVFIRLLLLLPLSSDPTIFLLFCFVYVLFFLRLIKLISLLLTRFEKFKTRFLNKSYTLPNIYLYCLKRINLT